jgi:hypothetical protein
VAPVGPGLSIVESSVTSKQPFSHNTSLRKCHLCCNTLIIGNTILLPASSSLPSLVPTSNLSRVNAAIAMVHRPSSVPTTISSEVSSVNSNLMSSKASSSVQNRVPSEVPAPSCHRIAPTEQCSTSQFRPIATPSEVLPVSPWLSAPHSPRTIPVPSAVQLSYEVPTHAVSSEAPQNTAVPQAQRSELVPTEAQPPKVVHVPATYNAHAVPSEAPQTTVVPLEVQLTNVVQTTAHLPKVVALEVPPKLLSADAPISNQGCVMPKKD